MDPMEPMEPISPNPPKLARPVAELEPPDGRVPPKLTGSPAPNIETRSSKGLLDVSTFWTPGVFATTAAASPVGALPSIAGASSKSRRFSAC